MEMLDTPDLGSGAARCGSSSLPARTKSRRISSAFSFQKLAIFFHRYNIGTTFYDFDVHNLIC